LLLRVAHQATEAVKSFSQKFLATSLAALGVSLSWPCPGGARKAYVNLTATKKSRRESAAD
jgi:hypothetical protein